MAKAPRIVVTLPTPHDATSRMAQVMHEEGVLGDFIVPLDVSRLKRLPPALETRLNLDQWRYPVPARSGAPMHEAAVAAVFRALNGRKWAPGTKRIVRWRMRALDRSAAKLLRSRRIDAVTVLYQRSPRVIATAQRLKIPVILFLNGDPWGMRQSLEAIAAAAPDEETRREVLAELAWNQVETADGPLHHTSMFVVESSRMARQARDNGHTQPAFVVGQGVEDRFFVPGPREYLSGPLNVVQISRAAYGKGVHHTNEAVQLAGTGVSTCTLAGWDASNVPVLLRNSRNLRFAGGLPKDGVLRLLQQSDVFVLPTYADPMPRAVLEAMACALPVITTPDSGYTDIIEDGINGFIVPTGDPAAVAGLLTRLSDDPTLRRRIGAAARVTAEANSWEAFAERFRKTLHAEILPALGLPGY